MRFGIFILVVTLMTSISYADTRAFECLPASDIKKEDVSFGKFEYVMKVPGKNIVLRSKPEFKWIESKPLSFVKDSIKYSIKYSSRADMIDCVYRTDSSGNGSDEVGEIDLKYRDPKSGYYEPESPNLWRGVTDREFECSSSPGGCSIRADNL